MFREPLDWVDKKRRNRRWRKEKGGSMIGRIGDKGLVWCENEKIHDRSERLRKRKGKGCRGNIVMSVGPLWKRFEGPVTSGNKTLRSKQ